MLGSTRHEMRVDVCSNCHPFFTGTQNIIDTAGQVERLQNRLEGQVRRHRASPTPPSDPGPADGPAVRIHRDGTVVLTPRSSIAGRLSPMSANPTPLAADGTPRTGTPSFAYGGQALMEGVLMRGRDAIAVALRHPDGRIVTTTEQLNSRVHTAPMGKWPFVRGLVVLYETLV